MKMVSKNARKWIWIFLYRGLERKYYNSVFLKSNEDYFKNHQYTFVLHNLHKKIRKVWYQIWLLKSQQKQIEIIHTDGGKNNNTICYFWNQIRILKNDKCTFLFKKVIHRVGKIILSFAIFEIKC